MFEDIIGNKKKLEPLDVRQISCPNCASWDLTPIAPTAYVYNNYMNTIVECNRCKAMIFAFWTEGYKNVFVEHNGERTTYKVIGSRDIM